MWNKVKRKGLVGFTRGLAVFFCLAAFVLGGLTAYSETPAPTPTPDGPLSALDVAESAILYNVESGTVMYSKNGDKRVAPSTTAKMMTALVAIEILGGRMDEEVTIPSVVMQNAVGTHMELYTGEVIGIKELLHGLIMANANDAAYMLALVCSDTIDNFVTIMNRTAEEYGMTNTNYVNPTGIDSDEAYTTAEDVLKLAEIAFENETYREIAAKARYTIPATNKKKERDVHTRNYMLSRLIYPDYYYKNASGLCAGSTEKGGYCIAANAEIDGMNFISVVMGAPGNYVDGFYNFICARALFDWGPSAYSYRTVIADGIIVGELKVELAEEYDYVAVVSSGSISRYIPKALDLDQSVGYRINMYQEVLTAPVSDKQVVGELTVLVNGEEVGKLELVTLRGLTLSRKENTIKGIISFFTNKTVLTVFAAVFVSGVTGVLIYARYLYLKKQKIKINAGSNYGGADVKK